MKAMILAAGLGTRLRPLTLHTPKPLLKVGGKPLIVWHIEQLKRLGIVDIVINTAWLGDRLVEGLGNGSAFGVNILWSHEAEPLETAGGIYNALPLLGTAPFLLINGDIWTRLPFGDVLEQAQAVLQGQQQAHLVLVDNPAQHSEGDFYLTRRGQVLSEVSSLQTEPAQRLTFAGVSVLSPKLFAHLNPGKAPLAPILRAAMQTGQAQGQYWPGAWVDVGTPERLADLDAQILAQQI